MTRDHLFTFSIVVLLIPSFSNGQPVKFDTQKLSDDIRHLIDKTKSVGTSVVITNSDSTIYFEGFGIANLEKNIPVTDQTLFGLGSITKTFTALGILKLVEMGKLHLNDKVLDLAPELPITNRWEKNFPVRVFHLLEHTSGFDEFHPKDGTMPVANEEFRLLNGIQIVKNSLKTRWEPGSRFAYSNVGYLVAGYIVEKLSGDSYNGFVKTKILEGLQMNHSAIRVREMNPALLAKSYSNNNNALPFKHVFTRPAASLFSSANDMKKFLQMMLNRGKMGQEMFLNATIFQHFEEHHSIKEFKDTDNGYCMGVFPRFYKGTKWYGHGGSFNKYNAEFEYSHELQLGIFVVSNGPNATKTVDGVLEIIHSQIPNTKNAILYPHENKDLESYTGYYILTSPRNQLLYPFTELFNSGLFIKTASDKLFVSGIDSKEVRLYARPDGDRFSSSNDQEGYQYVFKHSDPTILYTSLGFAYKKKSLFLMASLAGVLIISLFMIFMSQLVFMTRILLILIRKEYNTKRAQTFLEISAFLFLIGTVTFLLCANMENIHEPNVVSIILLLTTVSFPVLTIVGVIYLIKENLKIKMIGKLYLIGLSFSLMCYSSYLYYWDLLGFRIWDY